MQTVEFKSENGMLFYRCLIIDQREEDVVVGVDGLSSQNERLLEDSMERFARWPGSRVAVIDRVFLGW